MSPCGCHAKRSPLCCRHPPRISREFDRRPTKIKLFSIFPNLPHCGAAGGTLLAPKHSQGLPGCDDEAVVAGRRRWFGGERYADFLRILTALSLLPESLRPQGCDALTTGSPRPMPRTVKPSAPQTHAWPDDHLPARPRRAARGRRNGSLGGGALSHPRCHRALLL